MFSRLWCCHRCPADHNWGLGQFTGQGTSICLGVAKKGTKKRKRKGGKRPLNRHFSKEEIQLKRHMKRCSMMLIMKERKSKDNEVSPHSSPNDHPSKSINRNSLVGWVPEGLSIVTVVAQVTAEVTAVALSDPWSGEPLHTMGMTPPAKVCN